MTGLVIDNFAGGGGASTGIEQALGRAVDVAINHDEAAIAVHAANHPGTRHFCQSIYSVDPLEATGGAPVALVWFSPDCKHFSKAKGGKPREKRIRDLAHVVPHWIERLKKATPEGAGAPDVIMLENVEEFRQWGPLDDDGKPIRERQGEEFDLWVRRIRRLGYRVEWRELRACDYGAPTSRKRLFLVARRDGLPIVWPEPTHDRPGSPDVAGGRLKPWRAAAECIDWSLPCPSIFERARPLKDATCRRIAAGVMRYVVKAARPFIVPITHSGGARVHAIDDPLRTVTTARRGEMALVAPSLVRAAHGNDGRDRTHSIQEPLGTQPASNEFALSAAALVKLRNNSRGEDPDAPLGAVTSGGQHHAIAAATLIQTGYGERAGQDPRSLDIAKPLGTVVGGGGKHAAVAAFLSHYYTSNTNGGRGNPELPHKTIATGGQGRVVAAHLEQANTGMVGRPADRPLSTIVLRGTTQRLVETTMVEAGALPPEMMARAVRTAAFLVKYYGSAAHGQALDEPVHAATAKARFAVVTVTIDAVTFVLVDIGMRMLEPRELANAQGFPPGYVLDPVCWYLTDPSTRFPHGRRKYGRLPKPHQIAKIGNSVCPPIARALVAAQFPAASAQPDQQVA